MSKTLFYTFYEGTIGTLTLFENSNALEKICFGAVHDKSYVQKNTELLTQAAEQLSEYFNGLRREFTVPLNPKGTAFQVKVWNALSAIPYGTTKTYKDIAIECGNPKACRAVGMANNKNPIPIIIPCHRVIGASGSLVGYAGGLDIKKQLLSLETQSQDEQA